MEHGLLHYTELHDRSYTSAHLASTQALRKFLGKGAGYAG